MKLSEKAREKFEKVPSYLNKLAIALGCDEQKARRHWKKKSQLTVTIMAINLIQTETGLSESELFEKEEKATA